MGWEKGVGVGGKGWGVGGRANRGKRGWGRGEGVTRQRG